MRADTKICSNPELRVMRALLWVALVEGVLHGAGQASISFMCLTGADPR